MYTSAINGSAWCSNRSIQDGQLWPPVGLPHLTKWSVLDWEENPRLPTWSSCLCTMPLPSVRSRSPCGPKLPADLIAVLLPSSGILDIGHYTYGGQCGYLGPHQQLQAALQDEWYSIAVAFNAAGQQGLVSLPRHLGVWLQVTSQLWPTPFSPKKRWHLVFQFSFEFFKCAQTSPSLKCSSRV